MPNLENLTLADRLRDLDLQSPDYWTFGGRDRRIGAHAVFQYPAMMVPQMQGAILDMVRAVEPNLSRVLDPFVGSGTTLVESMIRGLDFKGVDINPLAVLVSLVKATVVDPERLKLAKGEIFSRIKSDTGKSYFTTFPNQQKWFSRSANTRLSRIARAIEQEPVLEIRRVFWVAFARVIRIACNSRRTTYKLHMKSAETLAAQLCDVQGEFEKIANEVVSSLEQHYLTLVESRVVRNYKYQASISIENANLIDKLNVENEALADIVITSPPYGDNATTVPYGQYSYLPLRWIPSEDIGIFPSANMTSNTHAIDTASLGGSMARAVERGNELCGDLPSYRDTVNALKHKPDALKRFCSFVADLHKSVDVLGNRTAKGGFHVWTVGERRIGGHSVPMASLVKEMLNKTEIDEIYTASRRILSKRMAVRNTTSDTMGSERIIIARKRNG